MKISSIVAALAFVVAPALAVNNFDPCAEKAPEVVAAISQFCTKLGDKSKIPNPVAGNGLISKFKGKKAAVIIKGDCSPAQWLPKEWCFRQFYQMCANGDKKGNRIARFGKNGCQHWFIQNPAPRRPGTGKHPKFPGLIL